MQLRLVPMVGQLCSPMADTSNVAAGFADVDTMTMIKRMTYYTVPTIILAIVAYTVLGFANGSPQQTCLRST